MALQGTLKDFGIAEILQLIGQQAKSGVLHLAGRDEEIHIAMANGNVVRAEHAGARSPQKLGEMLVRAEIITQPQLQAALDAQRRSLRRLGDILVEMGLCTQEQLRETTALQTTETVYRLFHWKSGTYQFEPGEVEWDPATVTPLRAESVLMEGFRQVDEWPVIRKKITSTAMTFEALRPIDDGPPDSREGTDVDAAFDALGEAAPEQKGEFSSIGPNERKAHALATPGRTVEKIVDLSRLGEFETCKALLNLVNAGYLRPIAPPRRSAAVGTYGPDWPARIRTAVARALATVALAAALAGIGYVLAKHGLAFGPSRGLEVQDDAAERVLARYDIARLRGALEVYRVERGEYPARLADLVDAGLATPRDLRSAGGRDYYYRRRAEGRFVLLPPVE